MSKRLWLTCGLLLALFLSGCGAAPTTHHAATGPTPTPSPTPISKPTTVYLGIGETVYALDRATGAKRWTYSTGLPERGDGIVPELSAIAAANGKVYFLGLTNDGWTLYALSASDGSFLWKDIPAPGMRIADEIVPTPGTIIVSSSMAQYSESTMAVDPSTGKTLWAQNQDSEYMIVGNNILFETTVNTPAPNQTGPLSDGSLQAVNPVTGAVLWHSTGHAYRDMALVGTTLYVNAEDALHAFDAQTGNAVWSHNFEVTPESGVTMTQLGSTLYLANNSNLYALYGVTHSIVWQMPFTGGLIGQAAAGVGCATNHAGMEGIDLSRGSLTWQVNQAPGFREVAADNGMCIVVGAPGAMTPITAVDAQTGANKWSNYMFLPVETMQALDGDLYLLSNVPANNNSRDTVLRDLSETDGSIQWTYDTHDPNQGLLAFG